MIIVYMTVNPSTELFKLPVVAGIDAMGCHLIVWAYITVLLVCFFAWGVVCFSFHFCMLHWHACMHVGRKHILCGQRLSHPIFANASYSYLRGFRIFVQPPDLNRKLTIS